MTSVFTKAQIQSLAPDGASFSAGGKMASATWASSGCSSRALWGEIYGSAKLPYRVLVDLTTRSYACSCPSRKTPCKHVLGLMLLASESKLTEENEPDWVDVQLAKRAEREAKKAGETSAPVEPAKVAKKKAAKKTADKRSGRVAEGFNELKIFLCDMIRVGIANLDKKSRGLFEERSKRLIDAQAPGVATMIADCAALIDSGDGWQELLLGKLGRIATLVEAYSKIDQAPEEFASEIRQTIGWTIPQKDVLASGERVEDRWFYLGATIQNGGRVRTKTTWLIGEQTKRFACRLDFAVGRKASFPVLLDSQVPMEGALRFFPGTSKLRALWEEDCPPIPSPTNKYPYAELASTIPEFFEGLKVRLASNPWRERFPAFLRDVVIRPLKKDDKPKSPVDRVLIDVQGRVLPVEILDPKDKGGFWEFVAISAERPITIFGEWNGRVLTLVSAWDQGRAVVVDGVVV